MGRPRLVKDGKVYEAVADRIAAMITAGTLRVGERVPSVRKLSRQMGVAVGTVLHAYRILEDRGRITARPQSGFYVSPSRQPLPEPRSSAPPGRAGRPTVGDFVMRMSEMAGAPEVVRLGHAVPSPDCLPTKQLNRISAAIARTSSRGYSTYDTPPGCKELRVQIARHYMEAGCSFSPEDVITTSGCQEALVLCLRAAVKPGGVVAVESPVFYGILQAIHALGMRALELPTYPREGVDLDALERAIETRNVAACLFVPNCHNPLGFIMPEEKKQRLVRMLRQREIPLIEDDTYGDLAHGLERPRVCKAFDDDGWVMLCSSFSKTLAPGARVGWCAPGRFMEEVRLLKFCNTVATATLPQLTIARYVTSGGYAHQLRRIRRIYKERVEIVRESVQRHFPEGTRASRPVGGHVLWVELPHGVETVKLFDRAAALKISIAPGPMFSTGGGYSNCLRLNCSWPCDARLEQAIATVGRLADEQLEQLQTRKR